MIQTSINKYICFLEEVVTPRYWRVYDLNYKCFVHEYMCSERLSALSRKHQDTKDPILYNACALTVFCRGAFGRDGTSRRVYAGPCQGSVVRLDTRASR